MTEKAYGIPRSQVVGSSVVSKFQLKDGKPVLVRMPKIDFINELDKALDQANAKGWVIVDMKKDWRRVFSGE